MTKLRYALFVLLIAGIGIGLGIFLRDSTPHAQEDQGMLAGFISRMISSPGSQVSIGAVEGPLSSNAVIRNVTVADAQGVYLRIDTIRLTWRRLALLSRRLEIDNLEIGRVELTRKPLPDPKAPPPKADGPLLPELPLKVEIGKLAVGELVLGEPVIGVAARFSAAGNATLGPPSEGLNAAFSVRRLDQPGLSALKLTFVPSTQQLDLALQHDEPAGGIVARLADIPGQPAVKLDLAGAGRLDDWRGRVAFDAGADINARGDAILSRDNQIRRLGLNLNARIEKLLPPAVAAVFAGDTTVDGNIVFGDDGGYAIERFRLGSQIAELLLSGHLTADRNLDIRATARALRNAGGATARGDTRLETLVFDLTARGPMASPQVEGRLDLRGLASPAIQLGAMNAALAAEPVTDGNQRYRITLDGRMNGLKLADEAISEALGDNVVLNLRASVDDEAITHVSDLSATTPNLKLSFAGRTGVSLLDGQVRAEILRLQALSRLAGRPLTGRGFVAATLSGDPSAARTRAVLEGRFTDLVLGHPIADRLAGRELILSGAVTRERENIAAEAVTLRGQHIAATVEGGVADGRVDLRADLDLPDLRHVDAQFAGAARANAHVSGDALDPDISLTITAPDARAQNRPIRDLRLALTARTVSSAPNIALNGSGAIDGKPLLAELVAQARTDGIWSLDKLAFRLGSVSADGQGQIAPGNLAAGRLAINAGNLDDLSPLALTRLSGSLHAAVTADAANGRQRVVIDGNAQRLVAGAATLNFLRVNLSGDDLFGRMVLDGEATVDKLVAGGETIERISFRAKGTPGATDLNLSAQARGFALAGAGKFIPGAPHRLDLASFSATRSKARIALTKPATLLLEGSAVRTQGLGLSIQGGELQISGKLGSDLDATVAARRVPLSALDIFAPGTGLRGTLDARTTLRGPAASPQGSYEVTLRGLSAPATRDAGVPALDITARGALQGKRATVDSRIAGGRIVALNVKGSAPIDPAGAFDLRLQGTLDAALANAQLAGSGRRVTGRLAVDGSLRGTRAKPDIQGTATLSGGSFSDPLGGVTLTNIEGRITGRGNNIGIERLTARAKNGGSIAVTGRVQADPHRNFPTDIRITADKAELVSSDIVSIITSLNLTVSGPLATTPRLAGRVDVSTIEVRIPERLPSAAEPLREARHINAPEQTRARLAQIARQRAEANRGGRGPVFNAALDVTLDAPGRVFVRGRGMDTELGGQIRLSGTTSDMRANGAFELRRGRLSLLTQRLDFTRGRVTFGGGDVIPDLDFAAETRATDVTVTVAVTGRATQPEFTLSSVPALPQDEVLSRLLFQRAAAGLSPFQAVQIAQAVATLSGRGGPDTFETARRALGVDNLDVTSGAGGPAVGASRAISDRVRMGVRAGAKPESSAVGVDIDLTRSIRIQTEIGADGRAAAGIGVEIEY